jgi:hypothetical protein
MAKAIGLPGFAVALYLYPVYHVLGKPRPYWGQAGDHYFYVVYSFVATGVLTVFAWDFFFPDLLDTFTIGTLPLRRGRVFRARAVAVGVLLVVFLFDSNFLAPLVLPAATDPPLLFRFLAAHLCAVTMAGLFSFSSILAMQGLLLAVIGERWFRRLSLWLQLLLIFALSTLLLLEPVVSPHMKALATSSHSEAAWLPTLWFLGIYQCLLGGKTPAGLLSLAATACWATLISTLLAIVFYPPAYFRKARGIIEGTVGQRGAPRRIPWERIAGWVAPRPQMRAIWQFVGQTIVGVPRYRVYLALYGGLGLALLVSAVLRIAVRQEDVSLTLSTDGLRAMLPIVAFWTISGLSATFQSPADQRGTWIFKVIDSRATPVQLQATRRWTLGWSLALCLVTFAVEYALAPRAWGDWTPLASQALVAVALCVLLTDGFFLNLREIPFTHRARDDQRNLAFLLIPYLGIFPAVVFAAASAERWIEGSVMHLCLTALLVIALHLLLRQKQKDNMRDPLQDPDDRDDRMRFPLGLGSR